MHQQNNYQQFPNFTQPPPTIEQSLQPIDDLTIEHFLIRRHHLTINTNGEKKMINHFQINGRDRLNVMKINLNNLIKQQKVEEQFLQNNISQISTSLWAEKINSLKLNQIKIVKLLTQFEELSSKSTNTEEGGKRKRRNKRKLKKVRRNHHKEKTEDVGEPAKSQPVDGDLQESYEKFEVERLRSVNLKRICECKRQLTLLDSLIELRCIRRKNCNVSGSSKLTSEKNFIEQIDQLKTKWTAALIKFNSLENELKQSLTSTCSENWLNLLFSKDTNPSFHDENDEAMHFKRLLDIRKSWDLCLVTDQNVFGSSIPPGWVKPNATPSKEWASFLVK